jgi:hypothetical protein
MTHVTGRRRFWLLIGLASTMATLVVGIDAHSQESRPASSAQSPPSVAESKSAIKSPDELIARGVEFILSIQEGQDRSEWPYEGVYRVGGQIPIGYRIGGTGICVMALLQAPGYDADNTRQDAVHRATSFIVTAAGDPLMSPDYDGGYDVRGWGYTYGLACLLRLKSAHAIPADLADKSEDTIKVFIDAIQRTQISKVGGWNYARGRGKDAVSPPSPFMTGPTLQALFEAKRAGYEVDADVVARGLDCLEQARTASGSFRYSGVDGKTRPESVPGSVGRMMVSESTLFLAGRSSVSNVRAAIDAFIVHWQWLDKRRAQPETHKPPYGIAPYYFYYAHYYAAQAVELLPENERAEYRRRINDLLLSVRLPNGTWNDRVFERTANFGTAMAIMAIMMPQTTRPATWSS